MKQCKLGLANLVHFKTWLGADLHYKRERSKKNFSLIEKGIKLLTKIKCERTLKRLRRD